MNIISSKNLISELLSRIDKPSMLRFDESYFSDINLIHCIVQLEALSIYDLDELMDIKIDESLIEQSSKVLINITSNANLRKIDMEAIAQILSIKTNSIEYHFNWQIDFDYDDNYFDLILIFVE
jgi:uncharacterized protein YpbB